ncbi:MAG: TonB-dependent receptor [Hymenobacteraceae bacterium]|nr:TonB-dependent receptor [Hymenobacteraceae bacterium]
MRTYTLAFFFLLTSSIAFAQATFSIHGRVLDKASGETLPGTSVGLVGTSQGGVSDGTGTFHLTNVAPGTYTLRGSFIGYQNLEQKVTVTSSDVNVTFRLAEDNTTLNEVQVVAQVAVERETPVAFSAVNEVKLRESLAGRDLPMILNETPGVYATQSGGGAGDSRISIRGFDQRNVAVMINGVPVNDMENGSVFWSNWDLGDVTRSLQVQRGLTASKLAVPSVGGTINVLTKGFDAKRGGRVRLEGGFGNSRKVSVLLNSGQLKGNWAVTAFGSRRTGNGWADGLYDDAWTYFGTVSKRIGKHQISLTGLGSPQRHGQRAFAQRIATFSTKKATELGADPGTIPERGYRYNANWGTLNRYTLNPDGSRRDNVETLYERENFYHKPQVNLNHFWNVTDKLFISNVVYASRGQGGGGGARSTLALDPTDGRADFQKAYDENISKFSTLRTVKRRNGTDSTVLDPEHLSTNLLRASVNSHKWYGFITSADYKLSDATTISAGIDGRYYRGEHYQKITDLLGGDYAFDTGTPNDYQRSFTGTPGNGDQNADPYRKLRKGDKFNYNYDGITKWIGGYGQVEFKKGPLAGFVSATVSQVAYQRIDYFRARKATLPSGQTITLGNTLVTVPTADGQGTEQVTRFESITVPKTPTDQRAGLSNDTTLFVGYGNTASYNSRTYRSVDNRATGPFTSAVVRLPGFTAKTGFNYNLTEDNNIFFNIGYLSRAQFFNRVFTLAGDPVKNFKNENIFSVEVGYGVNREGFKASLNGYNTMWYNRATTISFLDPSTGDPIPVSVGGLNAVHRGVELDIAQEISRQLSLNAAFSVGDWRWASAGDYIAFNVNNEEIGRGTFNPKGLHVGGSAQNQFMVGVRYAPFEGFYIRPTFTLFTKNYADFDPSALQGDNPQDAARVPTMRNVDVHAGYTYDLRVAEHSYRLTLNGSVLNALNEFFITDVPARTGIDPFNPSVIEVYFNQGRRGTLGLSIDF